MHFTEGFHLSIRIVCLCAGMIWFLGGTGAWAQSAAPAAPDTSWREAWQTKEQQQRSDETESAVRWHVWIRGGADLSVPLGDYFEGTTSGIGYEGDVAVAINPRMSLRMIVGHTGIKAEEGLWILGLDGLQPDFTVEREEVKVSASRYLFCLQYNQSVHPEREKLGDMWYVYNGLGVVVVKPKATVWVRENATGDPYVLTAEDSQTQFTMSVGGGYIFVPTAHVGIDVGANMDFVWSKQYTNSGAETVGIGGYLIDMKAALVFFL